MNDPTFHLFPVIYLYYLGSFIYFPFISLEACRKMNGHPDPSYNLIVKYNPDDFCMPVRELLKRDFKCHLKYISLGKRWQKSLLYKISSLGLVKY